MVEKSMWPLFSKEDSNVKILGVLNLWEQDILLLEDGTYVSFSENSETRDGSIFVERGRWKSVE